MASSLARSALIKGGLVIAVWVVLLIHSSSGQQPLVPAPSPSPPSSPPMGCSNCHSYCAQLCQKQADDRTRYCKATSDPPIVYKGCLEGCANTTCKGKTCAAHIGSCTIGTCDPQHCGTPCVQDCCRSCTSKAYTDYYINCLGSTRGSSVVSCTDGCTENCKHRYGCTGSING